MRFRNLAGKRRLLHPLQSCRMPVVFPGPDMMHLAGSHPFSLVVNIKQVAFRTEIDPVRRAQAGCVGNELALGCDLHAPAAPGSLRLVPAAETNIQSYKKVPVFIPGRTEREFMIIAGYSPLVAQSQELVHLSPAASIHY